MLHRDWRYWKATGSNPITQRDLIEIYLGAAKGFERDGRIEEARQARRQARLIDHKDGWR
jgi:hypothetical protein